MIANSLVNYFDKKSNFIYDLEPYYLENESVDSDLLNTTFNLWETMDADYFSCSKEDFYTNVEEYLRDYLYFLQDFLPTNQNELRNANLEYQNEYKILLNNIINNDKKQWNEVEQSLMLWKDAIPDKLLDESLLFLKFIYLYKKAEKQLGLLFPDKLKKEIELIET